LNQVGITPVGDLVFDKLSIENRRAL